jgi:uncharacterized protein YukE
MSTIAESQDPEAVLAGGAPDGGMGEYIEGLKKDCGFIISKVDSVVNTLTGFSLLEALFKPIAGDFNTVASMQKAWGNVGVSLGAIGDNYRSLSGQLPSVWEGQASHAAQDRLSDIADMHEGQQEATQHIQDQLGHVIEVAQATAEVVAAALSFINDIITELLLDAASGPFGWAKGAISAPGKARKVISLIHRGLEAIQKFTRAAKAIVAVLKYVNAGLSAADTVLQFGNAAASTAAGNHMDETSQQGFG